MSDFANSHNTVRSSLPSGEGALSDIASSSESWALFLDIDGTLLDIAETPDAIVVPPELPTALHQLSARLNGALALVTGRALPYADELFSPYRFPVAGLHGAERRSASGNVDRVAPGADFQQLKAMLQGEARQWPGVLVEDKGLAVAAHYRQAPEYQAEVDAIMERYVGRAGPDFTLQKGKMVVEIRPAAASKGRALEAFLAEEPFRGRKPIAIGDDLTDEAMFKIANALGGTSIRIGETEAQTAAQATLPSAARLREILAALSAQQ